MREKGELVSFSACSEDTQVLLFVLSFLVLAFVLQAIRNNFSEERASKAKRIE
jgi:hypothetical protein